MKARIKTKFFDKEFDLTEVIIEDPETNKEISLSKILKEIFKTIEAKGK